MNTTVFDSVRSAKEGDARKRTPTQSLPSSGLKGNGRHWPIRTKTQQGGDPHFAASGKGIFSDSSIEEMSYKGRGKG